MSRKKRVYKSFVKPDPIHGSLQISKFINCLMVDGKKSIVATSFYKAIEKLKKSKTVQGSEELSSLNEVQLFEKIIKISEPVVEVRSRRIGGSNYQIPLNIEGTPRAKSLSIKWIVAAIRSKKNSTVEQKMYAIFEDNLNKKGEAIKKKEQIEAVAEANRAYAHLAVNFSNNKKLAN